MYGMVELYAWLSMQYVDKFFKIHLRHIKRFHDVQLVSLSAKLPLKIMNLGGYVSRIGFLNYEITTPKNKAKTSKLIRYLEAHFSIGICQ